MKFIIAGYGYVGKAVKHALGKKHSIEVVDPRLTTNSIKDHYDADGVIICVSTPSDDIGNCDASNIFNVLDQIPVHIPVLVKSTTSPDKVREILNKYTEHSIAFSPEFLRANTANEDFLGQKYMIIGGDDPLDFWHMMFQDALPNLKIVHTCTAEEASLIKYAANSFLAIKVSFFNHLYDICEATGQDFEVVRHLVCQDTRIGTSHSMVPGPTGERGWGGHCFPKDTSAFSKYFESNGKTFDLLKTAISYNEELRK